MRDRSSRRSYGRAWWIAALAALALVLAACSTESGPENRQNSLRPKGQYAKDIDNLFAPILWIAIAVGVIIIVATIFVAVRFRRRKDSDDKVKQIHGNTPLEIGLTLVPAIILAVIAVPTVSLIFDLAEKPTNPLEVTVVGKQWWWQFDYQKQAGIDTKIVTADELHIPTGRDVFLDLQACDASLGTTGNRPSCNVIHSFWVPELAGKRDVVPGRNNQMKLRADEPGVYLGQCAEYCGLSHANMRFRVIAQPPDEFASWVAGQLEGPTVALADAGEANNLFTKKFQCTNCHTTEDSSVSVYGPNLTHLASRSTFASGYYELTRANLIDWILDAPSMIPMESEECRLPPPATCVGMPSFTRDTPPGNYPVMTRAEAETLADYLLELK
ncbi:MAG: cytochrome c oxidase subunit II [Acidimicrobiia bacterium]